MLITRGLGTAEVELAWLLLHSTCHPLKKPPWLEGSQLLLRPRVAPGHGPGALLLKFVRTLRSSSLPAREGGSSFPTSAVLRSRIH